MPGSKIYDVTDPRSWGGDPSLRATPDDPTDDDAPAINAAMRAATAFIEAARRDDRRHTAQQLVFLPRGTYHVATPIVFPRIGRFQGYIWLHGEGTGRSVLRLKSVPDGGLFGTSERPAAVVEVAEYALGRENPGNENYQLFVTDLSVVVPEDQPHAVGISYGAANLGAVRNVEVKAEGGGGHTGFALVQFNNGPGWVENLDVEGFRTGIQVSDGWGEGYGFSNIRISDQAPGGVGLAVADKQMAFERLHISQKHGDVQAVLLHDDGSFNGEFGGIPHLVCLDSSIRTTAASALPPIRITHGHAYVRNLATEGYGDTPVDDHGTPRVFAGGRIPGEYISVHGRTPQERDGVAVNINAPKGSLGLPAPAAPEIDPAAFQEWEKGNYEVIRDGDLRDGRYATDKAWLILDPSGAEDDTRLVQAGLDSGARYIGLLNREPFVVSDTLRVNTGGPRNVELIFGYMAEVHAAHALTHRESMDVPNDRALFLLGTGRSPRLFIQGLRLMADDGTGDMGDGGETADFILFQNNSAQAVVFENVRSKAASRHYRNGGESIGSKVHFENVEFAYNGIHHDTLIHFDRQEVWARQYNVEAPIRAYAIRHRGKVYSKYSTKPRIRNSGGSLWIFSQKSGEHNGIYVRTDGGGRTEMLSIFWNSARTNLFPVEPEATNFVVADAGSEFSLVGQERIRTYYDYLGNATQPLPHGNRFGVLVKDGVETVLEGTSLPTYLKYPGIDPFTDTDYQRYDQRNHFRVAGLVRVKN